MKQWEWDGKNNIRSTREEHDDKQESLASRISVNRSQLSEWESGKRVPTIENLAKIAKEYDVSIDYLCGLDKYKHKGNKDACESIGISEESADTIRNLKKNQKEIFNALASCKVNEKSLLESVLDGYVEYIIQKIPQEDYRTFLIMNLLYQTMENCKSYLLLKESKMLRKERKGKDGK